MPQLEHITPEQIAEYGVVAAPDRLTGNPQDNKAIFDRLVRELVAVVVNEIIDQANLLLQSEDVRTEQEEMRIQAEEGRASAEDARVQAEANRAAAEISRVQAEERREAGQKAREEALDASEAARETAEEARARAEAARVQAEADRADEHTGLVAQATVQAQEAAGSAGEAAESATVARSWAVGGTGSRDGEDENNAKYYCDQARQIAGAEYALKTEAQGYVNEHNASYEAHRSLFNKTKPKEIHFGIADWKNGMIVFTAEDHERSGVSFIWSLRQLLDDGSYSSSTWAVLCTDVAYQADTGEVTLRSADAYDGVFIVY